MALGEAAGVAPGSPAWQEKTHEFIATAQAISSSVSRSFQTLNFL